MKGEEADWAEREDEGDVVTIWAVATPTGGPWSETSPQKGPKLRQRNPGLCTITRTLQRTQVALETKSTMTTGRTALRAAGAISGEGLSSESSADNTPDVGGVRGWVPKGQLGACSAAWVRWLPITTPPSLGTMQRICLVSCPGKTYKRKVRGIRKVIWA